VKNYSLSIITDLEVAIVWTNRNISRFNLLYLYHLNSIPLQSSPLAFWRNSSYHSKFFLMKTILPARSGSIRFLNLLKRRDAALKMCSLGATVTGIQRYFCARPERIGS
jgi:hypothetical protein